MGRDRERESTVVSCPPFKQEIYHNRPQELRKKS